MLLAVSVTLFTNGCSKEELLTSYGTVVYTGTFSSGGCEWLLQLSNGRYEPHNLPAEFQIDGLNVNVTYRVMQQTANCPNAQILGGLIHLNRIKKV